MMKDQCPENYIVIGMNNKMNYLVNTESIIDLETNCPI